MKIKLKLKIDLKNVIRKIVLNHNCALTAKSEGDQNMAYYYAGQRDVMEELIGREVINEMIGDKRSNVPTKVLEKFLEDI